MPGPTAQQIDYYVRLFQDPRAPEYLVESFWWAVVRPSRGVLTAAEVVRRLGGDPSAMTSHRPNTFAWDDDLLFLEARGDAVVFAAPGPVDAWEAALARLSRDAEVHGTFWMVNNYNSLHYAADGVVVTELESLCPQEPQGADPAALDGHLGALLALAASDTPGPDWETAMATVESLTGVRLDAAWFDTPKLLARVS